MKSIYKFLLCALLSLTNITAMMANDQAQSHQNSQEQDRQKEEEEEKSKMLDQLRKMTQLHRYQMQQPLQKPLEFSKQEQPFADLLRAMVKVADESQLSQPLQSSLDLTVAANLDNAAIPLQITSKSDSHGWIAFWRSFNHQSLWISGLYATPNELTITMIPSDTNLGYCEITMNAHGVCHDVNTHLQKAHNGFAQVLRNLSAYSLTTFTSVADHSHLTKNKDADIQEGTISGECAIYGCTQNIKIVCSYELLKRLIQEKNSLKR